MKLVVRLLLAIVLISSHCSLFAQANEATTSISGQVVCGPDRHPAVGLHMAMYRIKDGVGNHHAPDLFRTGPDGRFSILMPLGSYYVCVVERPTLGRPAFADYYLDRAHPAKVDATDPAAAPPPVKIALELGVRITGRALRLDGTPVGKALVGAEVSGFGGEIDEQGRFTILGLPVGVDQALHVAPLDRHYAYFRLLRVAGGKLKPGGTFDVGDVTFVPLPERPNFVGTLSNADGTPYRGLTTVILLDKAGTLKTGADVREGHFERRVLTGEYRITTMASEGEGLPLGTVSIKAGQVAEMDLKIPNREKGGGGKAPVAATSPSTGPTGGK